MKLSLSARILQGAGPMTATEFIHLARDAGTLRTARLAGEHNPRFSRVCRGTAGGGHPTMTVAKVATSTLTYARQYLI